MKAETPEFSFTRDEIQEIIDVLKDSENLIRRTMKPGISSQYPENCRILADNLRAKIQKGRTAS